VPSTSIPGLSYFPISSTTVLLHILLGLSLLRCPWGFQLRTCLSFACEYILKVCPIHFLSLICWIICFSEKQFAVGISLNLLQGIRKYSEIKCAKTIRLIGMFNGPVSLETTHMIWKWLNEKRLVECKLAR
jgi:hypothetical protein